MQRRCQSDKGLSARPCQSDKGTTITKDLHHKTASCRSLTQRKKEKTDLKLNLLELCSSLRLRDHGRIVNS